MRDKGNYVGFWMLFVCCVYVLQVSMAMVALLQDGVALLGCQDLMCVVCFVDADQLWNCALDGEQ